MSTLWKQSWAALAFVCLVTAGSAAGEDLGLTLNFKSDPALPTWQTNTLTIKGNFPGGEVTINYIEAYCRAGSTARDWTKTAIGHTTRLVDASADGKQLKLHCEVKDGTTVDHVVTVGADEIDFQSTAHNPTDKVSENMWAQPCVRISKFTGCAQETYVPKCFVFLDGKLSRLPTQPWATKALSTPGQVYCPQHVDRNDVNNRPLSSLVPSNGLIGAFSGDDKKCLAIAWEPYQELFQGIVICIHADFRIGGLKPGETKKVRGKIYIVDADTPALLQRYEKDFPEQSGKK